MEPDPLIDAVYRKSMALYREYLTINPLLHPLKYLRLGRDLDCIHRWYMELMMAHKKGKRGYQEP